MELGGDTLKGSKGSWSWGREKLIEYKYIVYMYEIINK